METFLSLRKLEDMALAEVIKAESEMSGQMIMGAEGEFDSIKVSISQFYGIEINDFAVGSQRLLYG